MQLRLRWFVHLLIYYALPLTLLWISINRPSGEVFVLIGKFAVYALVAVMYIKPAWILSESKWLRRIGTYRRELGLLSFWLFFFHAAGLMYLSDFFSVGEFFNLREGLFWGGVAGIMMIVLAATSNKISVNLLKGNWKRVHYLAYPAFLFTLVHAGMANRGEEFIIYLSLGGLYIVLKVAQIWKEKSDEQEQVEQSVTINEVSKEVS